MKLAHKGVHLEMPEVYDIDSFLLTFGSRRWQRGGAGGKPSWSPPKKTLVAFVLDERASKYYQLTAIV